MPSRGQFLEAVWVVTAGGGDGCSWLLADRGRGCSYTAHSAQDNPAEQSIIWPQMSTVPRLRNSGLTQQDFKNISIILLPQN